MVSTLSGQQPQLFGFCLALLHLEIAQKVSSINAPPVALRRDRGVSNPEETTASILRSMGNGNAFQCPGDYEY